MEEPRHKIMRGTVGAVFILFLVVVLVVLYFYYFHYNVTDSNKNYTSSESTPSDNQDGETANENDLADTLYQKAQDQMKQQKYQDAISSLDTAIAEDPHQPAYYSKESEAYYNLGQKAEAIQTLEQGIAANPDNDLLKSKLDVMQKDNFNTTSGDDARE